MSLFRLVTSLIVILFILQIIFKICTEYFVYFLCMRLRFMCAVPASQCVIICYLCGATHRDILLNQTQIRLYLPCTDRFETKWTLFIWFQISTRFYETRQVGASANGSICMSSRAFGFYVPSLVINYLFGANVIEGY